jgi:hypothetical protein
MRDLGAALLLVLACSSCGSSSQREPEQKATARREQPTAGQVPPIAAAATPAAPQQTPAATPLGQARSAAQGEWPAIDLRACGITLRHPPDYFTPTNRIGKPVLREVELLEDTPELRELLAGRGTPSERPLTISFTSYAVDDPLLDPLLWLRKRKGPRVAAAAVQRVTIAGLPALFYHARGDEAAVDGVVWTCRGKMVEAKVYFYAPEDRLRQEFSRILTMLTVRGALVESPVSCSAPGLPCPSPQLSLCVADRWTCVAPGAKRAASLHAVGVR